MLQIAKEDFSQPRRDSDCFIQSNLISGEYDLFFLNSVYDAKVPDELQYLAGVRQRNLENRDFTNDLVG